MVALHTEGVDRNEIYSVYPVFRTNVALHTEGVDRNIFRDAGGTESVYVALHTEGVDRNTMEKIRQGPITWSPSTRRAWIEIS